MSEQVYGTVIKYLESRKGNWKFIFGSQVLTAENVIDRMKGNKKFRKFVLDEVVKTAVDLMEAR